MKSYNFDFLENLKFYNEDRKIKDAICDNSWCMYNENGIKELYIFQKDNNVIKSINGNITYCNYVYMPENDSIIVKDEKQYMIKLAFYSETINILHIEGKEGFAILISEKVWDYFNLKDNLKLFQKLFKREMNNKGKLLKNKLTTSLVKILFIKIIFWFLCLLIVLGYFGQFKNIPEHLFLATLGFFIGSIILVIALVNIIVNKEVKSSDKKNIQNWIKQNPNNPLNDYL